MAGFSEEDIQRVREANDITSVFSDRVPLRQRGRDFWCNCPIHEEKTPSCKLDPASQLWHCFGCGAGGDVFSFIMQLDDLDFPEAVKKLADRANISIEQSSVSPQVKGHKARLREVCKETALFYHHQLMRGKSDRAVEARSYLSKRGFGGDIPKQWQLGFAPGRGALVSHLKGKGYTNKEMIDANVAVQRGGSATDRFYDRVIFPILDIRGECIAFGGRIIGEGEPKYLNSQETPIFHKSNVLYGLDKAKSAMTSTGVAVVVEGYTDVIALHQAGVQNVVATLGTALTTQHIRILARHAKNKIVYLFDGDEAGQRAADRALEFIDESITPEAGKKRIDLTAVVLPDGLDPADFVSRQGGDALKVLIDEAQALIHHGIERRLGQYDLSRPEDRAQATQDALTILAPIKDSLLAKDYAVQIAGKVHAREEDVLAQLAKLVKPRTHQTDAAPLSQNVPPTQGRSAPVSPSEKSRRDFERQFLSVCAQHPHVGLSSVEPLAQTQWHEQIHTLLAESILDSLSVNQNVSAADIVTAAQEKAPAAAGLLTSGTVPEDTTPEKFATFLAEELAIGDMEENIAVLKQQLKDPSALDSQEYELLFESIVSLQKDLDQRRKSNKLF